MFGNDCGAAPAFGLVGIIGSAGEDLVAVHGLAGEEGRFPHCGGLLAGDRVTVRFIEGVEISGAVVAIADGDMTIRFDKKLSAALVEYFSPRCSPVGPSFVLQDSLGRPLPPLSARAR